MTARSATAIGRVKTALVFDSGEGAKGTVCTLLARIQKHAESKRVACSGLIKFEAALLDHLERQVLPLVDDIARALLPAYQPVHVEFSAVNLSAASVHDVGMSISGFSADAPMFLAALSALLQIPTRQDILASGHCASDRGDIGAVRGLSEKLAAAASDLSIRKCLIPSPKSDGSLESLLPTHHERARSAVIDARRDVQVVEITDVAELMGQAFDDESIVLGSLRSGFFENQQPNGDPTTPVGRAIRLLNENLESRFFAAIEKSLFPLNAEAIHELLNARATYSIRRERYPEGFGGQLRRLISSLPPASRRNGRLFPLLPKTLSLALCGLAEPEHYEDVQDLLTACSGKALFRSIALAARTQPHDASVDAAVASVLSELSAERLTVEISAPVDTARALFTLEGITAESDTEFWETVTCFYVTLLRHTGSPGASPDHPVVIAESHGLLEHAFADKGGVSAAKQEGRLPTNRGGMRFVLDALADQFKADRQSEYVRRLVAEAFDPLDWPATVRFMSALLNHLRPGLPIDSLPVSPAQLVPRCAEILVTYVRSRDRVTQLIRSL